MATVKNIVILLVQISKYMNIINCIICGNKKLKYIGNNSSFPEGKVYQCSKCQFALTEPLPTLNQLQEFYKPGFYIKDENLSGLKQRLGYSEQRALGQFKFIEKFFPKSANGLKALELGCSDGSLLLLLDKYGFDVVGYEPDIKMANLANERLGKQDNKVINQMFKEEDLKSEEYDLICSSHVLEHLANPIGHLTSIQKTLKKHGLLFLEIPNQYYLDNFVGSNAKKNGHLYCYSPSSIEKIIIKNGFKVLSLKTCGKNVKEAKKQNSIAKCTLKKESIVRKIKTKLNRNISARIKTIMNKREDNPFNTYWSNNKQQGQWIRIIASPQG